MNAQAVVNRLLEAPEAERHIETWQQLRPETAERIQRAYDFHVSLSPSALSRDPMQANIGIGNTQYEKREGKWYRLRRVRNPAYWDQAQYFFIAPGPGNLAFIAVKMPRRLVSRLWQRACAQIFRDATGGSWYKDHPVVDGLEEKDFERRATGRKPEPAYEIFVDGTWKRIKR
jgi:hypothetical protein